ncbi:hypothetical protein DFH29DRAFT_1000768 [Suillus ampliporus]|nr:hypothetical protein DFH29DRAFT_1000768 [Suillus ampliporus]
MHPALRNLEVICTISSYTQHESLPALASACRAFERPALNALWRDLPSVEPLIKCLPSDLFTINSLRNTVLQKPVDGKMWDTLCKYTSRVHSITQSDDSITQSDDSMVESLSLLMLSCPSALAASKLFPNLVKLTWNSKGSPDAADFLLLSRGPLVSWDLVSLPPGPEFDALPSPPSQVIEQVMHLQALHFLSLNFKRSSTWDAKSLFLLPGFHDLYHLDLSIDTLKNASNFLSSLQVVRSKKITISFTYVQALSPTPLSQLFAVIQERCDNVELESFAFCGPFMLRTQADVFTPLHACRNLTWLLLDEGCEISMSDKELCKLVRAWPKLQVLKISHYVNMDRTTVPTFHGLISLLQLCPALTLLALVIDTTKRKGIDLKCPGGGSCNENLETLVLGNSPIKSPLNVALILSGLFPRLEKVNLECWDTDLMNALDKKKSAMRSWASVNSFLSGFSVIKDRCIGA